MKGCGNSRTEAPPVSSQKLDLVGHVLLAGAIVIGVSQIVLLLALVRRAGRRATPSLAPSGDLAVNMLEHELDQLRGELYPLRNERDRLRGLPAARARRVCAPECRPPRVVGSAKLVRDDDIQCKRAELEVGTVSRSRM